MGYLATGEIKLTFSDTTTVEVLLGKEELEKVGYSSSLPDSLSSMVLEATGFFEDYIEETDDEGNFVLEIFVSGKWWSTTDHALEWLAERGVGITGMCTGEDGYVWGYDTPLGHRQILEYSYTPVKKIDAEVLENLQTWLEKNKEIELPTELENIVSPLINLAAVEKV